MYLLKRVFRRLTPGEADTTCIGPVDEPEDQPLDDLDYIDNYAEPCDASLADSAGETLLEWVDDQRGYVLNGNHLVRGRYFYVAREQPKFTRASDLEPDVVYPPIEGTRAYWDGISCECFDDVSYSFLRYQDQVAYLNWLSGDSLPPGPKRRYFAQICIMGLERRLMSHVKRHVSYRDPLENRYLGGWPYESEPEQLYARLIALAEENGIDLIRSNSNCWSYRYSINLHELARLSGWTRKWPDSLSPLAHELRLSWAAASEEGLLPAMAFDWYQSMTYADNRVQRVPLTRCREEAKRLFVKINQDIEKSIQLRQLNHTKSPVYCPMNRALPNQALTMRVLHRSEYPYPKEQFTWIADQLDAYSRFIGPDEAGRNSPEALALLPDDALSEDQAKILTEANC